MSVIYFSIGLVIAVCSWVGYPIWCGYMGKDILDDDGGETGFFLYLLTPLIMIPAWGVVLLLIPTTLLLWGAGVGLKRLGTWLRAAKAK
jgi:uncharacterized RDD family membrane protein YckC